ncbi:MAG: tRNA pseudouridine(55) synthase TruB, partial [Pseudomonadota bacterium]|nr:tRNA pseudouridine(55) synthase TruB [Pseudomonadota bacterium]
ISFGRQTTTDDREGEAVATSETRPDAAAIEAVLPRFTGTVMQRPPIFSAIKIDGARAYDIARKAVADGLETLPELAPRPVEIERLELRATTSDSATLLVACGKGTYIRSLARDVALALGTVGHVGHLRRLSVGPFSEADAISLAFLEELEHKDAAFEHLKPVTSALDDIPALPVSAGEAAKLRHGQTLPALGPSAETRVADVADRGTGVALLGDQPVALVTVKAGKIQPLRVFNL